MTAALAAQARSFGAGIAASPGVVGAELEGETMFARYRYRAYPTPDQQNMLARTFGCARVVFNDALRTRDEAYTAGEKISDTEVQRQVITLAKTTPEREWLTEVASVALVQAVPGRTQGVPELVRLTVRKAEGQEGRSSTVAVP